MSEVAKIRILAVLTFVLLGISGFFIVILMNKYGVKQI